MKRRRYKKAIEKLSQIKLITRGRSSHTEKSIGRIRNTIFSITIPKVGRARSRSR